MCMKLPILGCKKRKNFKNFFKCYKFAENRRDAILIAGAIYIATTVDRLFKILRRKNLCKKEHMIIKYFI
jgi:hypothetical protein